MTTVAAAGGAVAAPSSPPHAARLVRHLLALEGPLIQLWAWPGSGVNGVLRALCDRLGRHAFPLTEARLREAPGGEPLLAAGRAQGCRWYVAFAPAPGTLEELALRLAPGERLVFADWRRSETGTLEVERTAPEEALLRQEEVLLLWEERLRRTPSAEEAQSVRALHAASDGWYRPLVEILLATGGLGLGTATPEELVELDGVRSFLRHEVVARWSPVETERAVELALRRGADEGEPVDPALSFRLDDGGAPRLPRLLAAYLRRRSASPDRAPERPSGAPPARRRSAREVRAANAGPRPSYSVALFGPPEIHLRRSGDGRPIECRLRRSLQAFAYLASSPELRANRDELIAAIWPNEGERTIDRNFHPTLSHLRRALEGEAGEGGALAPLLFRGGVYQLNPDLGWEIDTREFQALAESGRRRLLANEPGGAADDWREAWRLYRGPYLQGFFDLWIAERRELLQQQYLELLRDLGDVCIRLERVEEAMDAYRTVLAEDPLQERVQVAVMRLYAAQGRRDLVKRQYERLCSLLLEELGVAPLAQTTEDYHRLMG